MEMLSKCRQLKLENRLGLVIIDYLQLMDGGSRRLKAVSRNFGNFPFS